MKRAILTILILSFFGLWVLLADYFFASSPDGLWLRHDHGLAAVVEQVGVSLYAPAFFASLGCQYIDPGLGRIDGSFFIWCLLQPWPLAVLIFRPWPQLSRTFRRVIIGYSAACLLLSLCGFVLLRHFTAGAIEIESTRRDSKLQMFWRVSLPKQLLKCREALSGSCSCRSTARTCREALEQAEAQRLVAFFSAYTS